MICRSRWRCAWDAGLAQIHHIVLQANRASSKAISLTNQRRLPREKLWNTSDLSYEHGCQNSDECLQVSQTTLQKQRTVFEGSQESFRPDWSMRRRTSQFISAWQDTKRNQSTTCVTFLDFEKWFNTIFFPALVLFLRKFGMSVFKHISETHPSLQLRRLERGT